jgi:hypothetical protein
MIEVLPAPLHVASDTGNLFSIAQSTRLCQSYGASPRADRENVTIGIFGSGRVLRYLGRPIYLL